MNEGDVVIIKSEINDKDEVMKNSKDNENAKNQNPPPQINQKALDLEIMLENNDRA